MDLKDTVLGQCFGGPPSAQKPTWTQGIAHSVATAVISRSLSSLPPSRQIPSSSSACHQYATMKLLSSTSLAATALVLLTADAAKYKTCTEQERQSVFGGLTNELKSCAATSTFDLTSNTLPTSTQRQAVCKCTDLIKRLGDLSLPRCNLVLDGSMLSFKDAVTSVFTTCGISELKEVPATLAPGDNSTDTTASDDTVAGEASLPSSASKSQGSTSSSGSDLAIETTKPTTTPKPTTAPKPTATAKNSSSNATATPTSAPTSGGVSVSASASLSVVVVLAAYVSL